MLSEEFISLRIPLISSSARNEGNEVVTVLDFSKDVTSGDTPSSKTRGIIRRGEVRLLNLLLVNEKGDVSMSSLEGFSSSVSVSAGAGSGGDALLAYRSRFSLFDVE